MKWIFTYIALCFSTSVFGQIPDILTHRHKDKIESISSAKKKLKKYRSLYSKDSLKNIKQLNKYWKSKLDSLSENKLALSSDSLDFKTLQGNDSAKFAALLSGFPSRQSFEKQYQDLQEQHGQDSLQVPSFEEYYESEKRKYLEEKGLEMLYADRDSLLNLVSKDSLTSYASAYAEQRKQMLKQESESYGKELADEVGIGILDKNAGEFDRAKQIPNEYKEKYGRYSNLDSVKTASIESGKEFLTNNPIAVEKAQAQLSTMKKKYSSMPNSNDLSTATKANSMEGRPLTDRIWLGGSFQFSHTDPVTMFFDPSLGYKLNKRWVAGIGAKFEFSFGEYDTLANNYTRKRSEFGYKVFTNYDIYRSFYLTSEFESNKTLISQTEQGTFYQWTPSLFMGVGKTFTISYGFQAYIALVYDFLHDSNQSVYSSPFSFRFGFALPGLRGLGLR